jgi:succinate dehydrogenase / fumarate reductase flavoprotein subunit
VVFGRAVGLHLQESIAEQGDLLDATEDEIDASLARLNRWNGNRNGEDPVAIRKALQNVCSITSRYSAKAMRWRKVWKS